MEYQIGDFVKIRRDSERFWLEVRGSIEPGFYLGRVNNNLVSAPYEFGEDISFQASEVIDHMRPDSED